MGMPQGGPGMGAPNFRGMGAPPNRMPAPWMQNQQQPQPQQQAGSQPSMQSQLASSEQTFIPNSPSPAAGASSAGASTPNPVSNGRMPAPWMRPQAQGQGMSPASRMQSQGPQRPGMGASQGGGTDADNRQQNTY